MFLVFNSPFDLTFLKAIFLFLIIKKSALFSIIVNSFVAISRRNRRLFAKWISALKVTEAVTTGVLQKSCS